MSNVAYSSSITPVNIEDEMKRSYLDYAMSVIVSRAIPDVRDGLKPVHRRILYAMHESSCDWNKPYKKSARIVGEVMGKYHPHGDAAIYDSLVRMAQEFSLRLPLIDGQGNFGSMDGDSAAAMRYTESRLAKVTHKLLTDIDKNTVEFQDNYDGSEQEPKVLPAEFPNLLVNGSGGIAVGMATNIPPHNLGEVIDGCCAYIDDNTISSDELRNYIKGPDFPTGGIIVGMAGLASAINTGRGSVIMRGRTHVETVRENREAIIITEIPYQVNKARMIEKMAELVRDKKVEGISDLRDESDKSGVRVVVELKKDAVADVVLSQLFAYSPLQTSFGVNMLALNNGRPQLMNVKQVIEAFVAFREEVTIKRTIFNLNKARDRAHILIGLNIAVSNIDEMIEMIKTAPDPSTAKDRLLSKKWKAGDIVSLIKLVDNVGNILEGEHCYLTDSQAKAILDMKLQRLTGLEHQKIADELKELSKLIEELLSILHSRENLLTLMKDELNAIKKEFATPRRTSIEQGEFEQDIESLIQREDMVVTVTMSGYVKRVPLSSYRAQKRGGKGRAALTMKEEDVTIQMFVTSTHSPVLFFSNKGIVYKLKVFKLPLGTPQSKGRAFVNIFPLGVDEKITNILVLPEGEEAQDDMHIMFATASGKARRNDISDFWNVQANGKIAMRLADGDSLIGVKLCMDTDHILLSAESGKAIRFPANAIRVFKSRTSDGVKAIKLAESDKVVSMSTLKGAEISMEIREEYMKIPVDIRMTIAKCEDAKQVKETLGDIHSSIDQDMLLKLAKGEEFIMTVTENGYGKRSSAYEYRVTNRGGSGIVGIITSVRNGKVVDSFPVKDTDQMMLLTDKGKLIRSPISDVRIAGRNTQGVTLLRTAEDEKVVSAVKVAESSEEESEATDEEAEI